MHKKADTRLHFVGIGGIGMSGIAEVFFNQGYQVSGSDVLESELTRRLRGLGVKVQIGHYAENTFGADVVVISSAIKATNPEVIEARKQRIPVIPRAEMLGELMRGKTGIAVGGTHGKTTTTSMIASILTFAGVDPTIVIGGKVDSLGGNAKLGSGEFVLAEADESDGSFLHLPATYAVVTNIDNDHLDHFGSLDEIENTFVEFVGHLPFYGNAVVCLDDPGVKKCLGRFTKPVTTYGMNEDADYIAKNVVCEGLGSRFEVWKNGGGKLSSVVLNVPGRHNVLNALASFTIGLQLGVSVDVITQGLKNFTGVKRRFEIRWRNDPKKQAIVDDYGHHPTEVAATLAAARNWWSGRIIAVFQPHRYSRTLHCREGFLTAFQNADVILLTDIYAAGEEPIDGVTSEALAKDLARVALVTQKVVYLGDLDATRKGVLAQMHVGDLVLCLGAGSITRIPEQLIESLDS